MATPAELVRGNCDQLPAYISALFTELLLAGPSAADGTPVRPSAPAAAPPPGDAAAFYALNTIWEAVFRIEEWLRDENADPWDGYDLGLYPRQRRGNSAQNFLDALKAIPRLAAGRDEDTEAAAARILEHLSNLARRHPAIDEAQKWRHIPGRACHYCGCYFLKVLLDRASRPTGHVECFGHDETRAPCRAVPAIEADDQGRVGLRWADGTFETMPGLDAA